MVIFEATIRLDCMIEFETSSDSCDAGACRKKEGTLLITGMLRRVC